MTPFKAVLLLPVDQQGTNQPKIDPAGVAFDAAAAYDIWRNFSYDMKDHVGSCTVSRDADGSLMAAGQIDIDPGSELWSEAKLAIGVFVEHRDTPEAPIAESRIMSIGLTWNHADPAQPSLGLA